MLGAGVETREGRDTLLVTTGPPWKVLDEDAYIDRESLRQACSGEWRLRWWTTAFNFQFSRAKMRVSSLAYSRAHGKPLPLPPFSCSMLCFASLWSIQRIFVHASVCLSLDVELEFLDEAWAGKLLR